MPLFHSKRKHSYIQNNGELSTASFGTIKIECSGAYIANDHLLLVNKERTDISASSSSTNSSRSSLDTEESEESPASTNGTSQSLQESNRHEYIQANGSATTLVLNGKQQQQQLMPVPIDTTIDQNLTKRITLPQHSTEIIHISVDIGGTLTKLVYFTRNSYKQRGGKLHFRDFQTENFTLEVLDFIIALVKKSCNPTESNGNQPPITHIMATGGGAHKFYQFMKSTFEKRKLPIKIVPTDEMECLIKGLDWLITKIPNEIFTYDLKLDKTMFVDDDAITQDNIYPYLLVNIGSGVSMIKVTGPGKFERIGGSSLGGGTLWGLLSLLTDAKDYNEMLEMASKGNNENVDLLVGDIYGTSYNKIGLKASHIASSFAKVFKKLRFNTDYSKLTPQDKLSMFKQQDIAVSLLYLILNNIGQISYLQALRFGLKRIYFGGSYISGHMQTIHTLSYAVNFWSNGDMQSYFLRHEGYLGSVGAFMMGPDTKSLPPTRSGTP